MRFHYQGRFSGDEADLPQRDPLPAGAVAFREPDSTTTTALVANGIALALLIPLGALVIWRSGGMDFSDFTITLGILLSLVFAIPHEFLHAIWFREDVYLYTNLRQGMLFVVGSEDMTKGRFIILSLFPAIVLGIIPLVIFLINPSLKLLGYFGLFSFISASGDFINVFNALTQMPAGALTFLHGYHSYWYLPSAQA